MGAGIEYNQDIPKEHMPVLCWGHKNLVKQRGIVTYGLALNRIRPSAHFPHIGAFWNTVRRSRDQFLYVVPPFIAAYLLMEWANERNQYLNSKKGRAGVGEDD